MNRTEGLNTRLHLAVDGVFGMPARVVIPQGATADCTQASRDYSRYLLADCGYDSDAIVEQARTKDMNLVIPPRRN